MRESNDRIHGRANFVTHIRKKKAFGSVGGFGIRSCFSKLQRSLFNERFKVIALIHFNGSQSSFGFFAIDASGHLAGDDLQ
ncbi:MAG: hypothetical protein AAB354_13425 [candidate division KSB1 bacterium]